MTARLNKAPQHQYRRYIEVAGKNLPERISTLQPSARSTCIIMPMRIDSPPEHVAPDDFARRFSMRAGNLMWLLGAGASASAGIPTATDMVWEFKQQLYVSQRRASLKSVGDLSNPAIRAQLQSYIDAAERFPPSGAPDEYAALFEAAWPNEGDRRTYIDGKLSGSKPSYGHLALATLMRAGQTKLVWTTNFDTLVADACAKIYGGTAQLTTATLDLPDLAAQAITGQRWPIEVKLHGDFRSRRLKNTGDELRQQDSRLRQNLVESCQRFGLVVVGYSGRDESVMDTLFDTLNQPAPFPAGLFWLHRGDEAPLSRVTEFLKRAAEKKVDGGLVQIENFDEALRDLLRLQSGVDRSGLDDFASSRRRWTAPALISGNRGWPVVRLNALPITLMPTVCRRVVCNIGGYAEVRAAIEKANVAVLAGRSRAGVLAFGSDASVRSAFEAFSISDFDLHPIEARRLRYDSAERGLLRKALSRALAREHSLDLQSQRSTDLLSPADDRADAWKPLAKIVGSLAGVVKDHAELRWREGVGVRLDWADDRLWLLIESRTIFNGLTAENKAAAADFARERSVKRYNRQLNDLIAFWANLLAKDGNDLRALDIGDGVDAMFRFSPNTAFSRRIRA